MKKQIDGPLSVIVPVYKVEPYLDRCVDSIVNQTYTNLEIILVDDGSPDRCPQMCDEWAQRDSRLRVIHKENGGSSDARNVGIAAATGKYLAFVDSDDYIAANMYKTMIAALERTNSDIACCGRYIVTAETKKAMHCMDRETVFTNTEAIKEMLLGGYIDESPCDKLYRRELFSGIVYPKGETNEDVVVTPRLFDRSSKIVYVGTPLYYYCQNPGSITKSSYSRKKRVVLKHLDEIKNFLEQVHPDLLVYFDALQGRYCQSTLYLLLDNKAVYKTYQNDYQEFYLRFKKSFRGMNRLVKIDMAEKIKGFLIYCKLYYFLHYVAQMRKRGK